jgi:two-component system, sensor histidine kinase PdtaS
VIVTAEATQTAGTLTPASGTRTLLDALGAVMQRKRGPVFEWAFAASVFVVALFGRMAVNDLLPPGFPFLTFFPAVLVAAVFAGLRAGIVVAVLSGIASWFFFIDPVLSFRINTGTTVAMLFYVLIVTTKLVFIATTDMALRRLRAASAQTARLARARELMMAEMQHRVSNNLATVAALLRAQSGGMEKGPAREALAAAQQRIMTVSRLQRRLHRHDRQDVELGAYLSDIASDAAEAAGIAPQRIDVDAVELKVTQDQALPLGLIVCELLLNAFEHGAGRPDLRVGVTLNRCPEATDGRIAVTIEDNGPGLPEGFDLSRVDSLGLSVAQQFAAQLDGQLVIGPGTGGGVCARVIFYPAAPVANATAG